MKAMTRSGIVSVFAACFATAALATPGPVTWYVDASAAAGGSGLLPSEALATIQSAVDKAASGDTVQIAAGVYQENVVVEGKSLTIVGSGRENTILDANESGRPLYLKGSGISGTRVKSLCLANGRADVGAGLYVDTADMDVGFLDGKITDCVSTGNGAAANGSAWIVRSLVGRCWSTGNTMAVFTGVKGLFSSVIIGCGRKIPINWNDHAISQIVDVYDSGEQIKVVNCTFSNNEGRLADWINDTQVSRMYVRNCAFFGVVPGWVRTGMNVDYSFSSRGGVVKRNVHNIGDDDSHGNTHYQVVAPFSDWHPVAGADIIGRGSNDAVTDSVPEEYRGLDYYGNTRIQDGTVDMGAAEGGVALSGGIVFFPVAGSVVEVCATNLWVNGYRVVAPDNQMATGPTASYANGIHFASTDANRAAVLEYRYTTEDRSLAIWGCTNQNGIATHPNYKGRLTFVLPFTSGVIETNWLVRATGVKWVSPDGDNSNSGTFAAPYRKIQSPNSTLSDYGVAFAKRGIYAEGEILGIADSDNVNTTSNRLYLTKKLYIASTDGPEATVIRGNRATGEYTYDGCGKGAMRCVQTANGLTACVCGFTLTGGATDASPIAQQKTDKTGNSPNRGNFGGSAAQGYVWAKDDTSGRLQIVDCIISNNVSYFGTVYCGIVKNCILADNRIVKDDSSGSTVTEAVGAMGVRTLVFGSLSYGNDPNAKWMSNGRIYDSTIIGNGQLDSSGTTVRNTAFLGGSTTGAGAVSASRLDFADFDNGDYRPVPGSKLLTNASTDIAQPLYWNYGTTSLDGLDYTPESGLGLVVGAYRGAAKYPATAHDWYVNAVDGNDANDGLTPATAKKTLAAVLALTYRGDVVHAARGTYNEGEMTNRVNYIQSGNVALMGSRAVIPEGVSLVADEGPEVTFIEGRLDPYNGIGANALRGVYMEEDTLLEGFTVKTCATVSRSYLTEQSSGACVVAPYANVAYPAVIRNCHLTDAHARSASAAFGGVLERCRIDNCSLTSDGLFYRAKLDNCLVVSTVTSGNMSCFSNIYGVRNSTIYIRSQRGNADFDLAGGSFGFENSIIYYGECNNASTIKNAKNCIIKSVSNLTIASTCTGTIAAGELSDLLDTTTWRPVAGSAAIDAGNMTLFAANPSTLDCGGGQRVYSGRLDIGAYEYNPSSEFSTTLVGKANKNVVIVGSSPETKLVEGGVLLRDGAMGIRFERLFDGGVSTMNVEVTGGGTLVILDAAGNELGRYTSADGKVAYTWKHSGSATTADFRLVYAGGESDAEGLGVMLSDFNPCRLGMMLIFR